MVVQAAALQNAPFAAGAPRRRGARRAPVAAVQSGATVSGVPDKDKPDWTGAWGSVWAVRGQHTERHGQLHAINIC